MNDTVVTVKGKSRDHVSRAHSLNDVTGLALYPRLSETGNQQYNVAIGRQSVYDKSYDLPQTHVIVKPKFTTRPNDVEVELVDINAVVTYPINVSEAHTTPL